MATPEAKASHVVGLRASAWGSRVFRNNSGVLMNQNGVPVRFGLGNESKKINDKMKTGDSVGWTQVTITPEMVGKQVAIFTNLEIKADGFIPREVYPKKSRENAQDHFNKMVIKAGGIAGFASNEPQLDDIYNQWINKVTK